MKAEGEELLPERAYEYIKAQILNMNYRPGQVLAEVKIAEELGISRTPVRDALRRLTGEGLVTVGPGRERVVYTLSLSDIGEIFDIKESLEGLVAAKAAANRSEEQVAEMEAIVARMEPAAASGDLDLWRAADDQFHDLLYRMAGNQRARQIIINLNEQWHRLRVGLAALQGRMQVSVAEHRQMAELIRLRDASAAEEAMRSHLSNLRTELVTLVKHFVIPYVGENM